MCPSTSSGSAGNSAWIDMDWLAQEIIDSFVVICVFYILLRHNTFKSMTKGYTKKTESGEFHEPALAYGSVNFNVNLPAADISLFTQLAEKMGWTFSQTKKRNNKTSKNEALDGLKEALTEFKAVQNGEAQSRPLEELINEL